MVIPRATALRPRDDDRTTGGRAAMGGTDNTSRLSPADQHSLRRLRILPHPTAGGEASGNPRLLF